MQPHAQHQAIKSRVSDQQVAAPAQHKQRYAAFSRPRRGLDNLLFAGGLDKPARRSADAKSGEGRKRLVFFNEH